MNLLRALNGLAQTAGGDAKDAAGLDPQAVTINPSSLRPIGLQSHSSVGELKNQVV